MRVGSGAKNWTVPRTYNSQSTDWRKEVLTPHPCAMLTRPTPSAVFANPKALLNYKFLKIVGGKS